MIREFINVDIVWQQCSYFRKQCNFQIIMSTLNVIICKSFILDRYETDSKIQIHFAFVSAFVFMKISITGHFCSMVAFCCLYQFI